MRQTISQQAHNLEDKNREIIVLREKLKIIENIGLGTEGTSSKSTIIGEVSSPHITWLIYPVSRSTIFW